MITITIKIEDPKKGVTNLESNTVSEHATPYEIIIAGIFNKMIQSTLEIIGSKISKHGGAMFIEVSDKPEQE